MNYGEVREHEAKARKQMLSPPHLSHIFFFRFILDVSTDTHTYTHVINVKKLGYL